jgi:hypothetical protein
MSPPDVGTGNLSRFRARGVKYAGWGQSRRAIRVLTGGPLRCKPSIPCLLRRSGQARRGDWRKIPLAFSGRAAMVRASARY